MTDKAARARLARYTDENELCVLPLKRRRLIAADINAVLAECGRLRWGFILAMLLNVVAWLGMGALAMAQLP